MIKLSKKHYIIGGIGILFIIVIFIILINKNNTVDSDYESFTINKEFLDDEKLDLNHSTELFNQGKLKELIGYYENFINDNSSDTEKLLLVETYLSYGNSFYSEEEYSKKALEILNKMSDNFQVLYNKGYAHEIIKEYDTALEFYTKASKLNDITGEEKAIILNQIGHIYDLKGDISTANDYYQEAEELGYDIINNLINRGRFEYRTGNFDESESYFSRVISNTNNNLLKAEMYYNLSSIYLNRPSEIGKNEAIEYAKKGIEIQENYPFNYLNLGIGYYLIGEYEEMLSPLEKANELYPDSVEINKYLGIYYYTIDMFNKAVDYFKIQLEKAENDITIMEDTRKNYKEQALFDLARSYAYMKDADESIKYLDELLLNGENPNYYISFMIEYLTNQGAFTNLMQDSKFNNAVPKYKRLYNK